MSRKIKFRLYSKLAKKYIDYITIGFIKTGELRSYSTKNGVGPVLDDSYIVEQSTALKDKNGKEIYEGDILGNEWGNGYISWCDKCKQFQYYISGECMACSGDVQWYELVADDGKLEVIGNIHEDPEMIGGEE